MSFLTGEGARATLFRGGGFLGEDFAHAFDLGAYCF
jgi:hypothetical protein